MSNVLKFPKRSSRPAPVPLPAPPGHGGSAAAPRDLSAHRKDRHMGALVEMLDRGHRDFRTAGLLLEVGVWVKIGDVAQVLAAADQLRAYVDGSDSAA